MNFLKQLANMFSGSSSLAPGGDAGLYYYVRCDRCGEVIKVRINRMNDLSQSDDGKTLFARKTIVGQRCYNRIEAEFTYNANRQLVNTEIQGGKLATEEDFEADQENQQKAATS